MTSVLADIPSSEITLAIGVQQLTRLDTEDLLFPVLSQLAVIVAVARLFGSLARRVGQPTVVGEIFAGLLLGPSLLGWLAPDLFAALFRPTLPGVDPSLADAVLPKIFTIIAQLGLIFLMFLVGLELDAGHVRTNGRAVALISVTGVVFPFALGVALAPIIHPYLEPDPAGRPVSLTGVALFMGLTMGITAIPVLGRIMVELNITRTRVGAITLAAAGVSDAAGWILLASIAAAVRANFDPVETLRMAGFTAGFVLFMIFVARPLLVRYFIHVEQTTGGGLTPTALAVLFVSLFLSSVATNRIGIFAVFGAFVLGATLSGRDSLREAVSTRLRDVVNGFFVPVFFTYTGLQTDLTNLGGTTVWLICAGVITAAVLGKLVGCGLAARLGGFTWREAGIIGSMMNARGLMALIAINLGSELGVVPPSLYAVLVLMAVATTALTTPMLLCLRKGTEIDEPIRMSEFLAPAGRK